MIKFTHCHSKGVAKRYELVEGKLIKTAADPFRTGPYKTISVDSMRSFAKFLTSCTPGDVLLAGINRSQQTGTIGFETGHVRRQKHIFPFAENESGVLVVDSDNLTNLGISSRNEFENAIDKLFGDFDHCISPSASSGISTDTECGLFKGVHTFLFVKRAQKIPDMLEILHKRSVLLGYVYPTITASGLVLTRSLVDLAMKTPNQPCFEGGAIRGEGVSQSRKIEYTQAKGKPTFLKLKPLSEKEEAKYLQRIREQEDSVALEAREIREAWVEKQGKKILKGERNSANTKANLSKLLASERPTLPREFEILTDKHGIKTVAELLGDPEYFHEATCADPFDPDYGRAKAKIYLLDQNVMPAIHSFAHGGRVYFLEVNPFVDGCNIAAVQQSDSPSVTDTGEENIDCILTRLKKLSATGDSQEMKAQMLKDKYVIEGLAILGQFTTFYAAPNTGKTLITLAGIKAQIESGEILGKDVFYVNADDSYNAAVAKIEIAEECGMEMLVPNQNGFKTKDMIPILEELTNQQKARDKVVVLDTLKKFTDLMDKRSAAAFGNVAREFVAGGGTLICLAHTNKHKNSDGRGVYAGTSDISDDADCYYIIDKIQFDQTSGTHVVEFINHKSRGDVEASISYRYTRFLGESYLDLLNSVEKVDSTTLDEIKSQAAFDERLNRDIELIEAICEAIRSDPLPKSELITKVNKSSGFSHNKIREALKRYAGSCYKKGARWEGMTGAHNKIVYNLVDPPSLFS